MFILVENKCLFFKKIREKIRDDPNIIHICFASPIYVSYNYSKNSVKKKNNVIKSAIGLSKFDHYRIVTLKVSDLGGENTVKLQMLWDFKA